MKSSSDAQQAFQAAVNPSEQSTNRGRVLVLDLSDFPITVHSNKISITLVRIVASNGNAGFQ